MLTEMEDREEHGRGEEKPCVFKLLKKSFFEYLTLFFFLSFNRLLVLRVNLYVCIQK